MSDRERDAPSDPDPAEPRDSRSLLLADEARRWQAEQHGERRIAGAGRGRARAAGLAGLVLYVGGPMVAVPLSVVLTGGLVLALPITIAACGAAGFLWAGPSPGLVGALQVLFVGLVEGIALAVFAFIIAAGLGAFEDEGEIGVALILAAVVLIMVASAEAGYLARGIVSSRR